MSNRKSPWLFVLLAPFLLAMIVAGLWVYGSLTEKLLDHVADSVPSSTLKVPGQAGALALAGRAVRESVAGQILPGVSVAAGKGGAVVWAEVFGYADLWRRERVAPEHRFRLSKASILLTSAAGAGRTRPAANRRRDPAIRAGFSQETVAREPDGVDGAHIGPGLRQAAPPPTLHHRSRGAETDRQSATAFPARQRVPPVDDRLGACERRHGAGGGGAVAGHDVQACF